jgi:hypothetical protein
MNHVDNVKVKKLGAAAKMAKDVTIGGYPFVCVALSEADFSDVAAVYAILCVGPRGSWTVLDVGQSGRVGSRIDEHERRECWSLCVSNAQ